MSKPSTSGVTLPAWPDHDEWTIFCAAVDNYGDIGVCWRLARQLVHEHGLSVNLFVDDWEKTLSFLGRLDAGLLSQTQEQGVRLCHWHDAVDWQAELSGSSLVIEAFGCALPDTAITGMATKTGTGNAGPCWLNLEYLSAEPWVESYHRQSSLTSTALSKTFFFPGFTAATGGLLRECNLLAQHQHWQTDQRQTRAELLQALGINAQDLAEGWHSANLLVSLFAYTRPAGSRALSSWFAAMAEGGEPALCLVPAGDLLADVAGALGRTLIPSVGDVMTMGSLSVVVIPFLPMDDYDRLLSVCDLNLVRGEDSFVRAQWAAKPLVWHIYPQQDDAHRVKLDAFLARYGDTNGGADSREVLLEFNRFWNLDADCGKLWHDLRPQLPDLIHGARNWQQKLAELPDLASSLMQFYRNRP